MRTVRPASRWSGGRKTPSGSISTRRWPRWNFGATFRAESHRDDDVYDSSTFTTKRERIAGFGVWDLRVSRELMPGLRAALSVDNVADKEYATARYAPGTDYISAGRIVFLSARYDFHP